MSRGPERRRRRVRTAVAASRAAFNGWQPPTRSSVLAAAHRSLPSAVGHHPCARRRWRPPVARPLPPAAARTPVGTGSRPPPHYLRPPPTISSNDWEIWDKEDWDPSTYEIPFLSFLPSWAEAWLQYPFTRFLWKIPHTRPIWFGQNIFYPYPTQFDG